MIGLNYLIHLGVGRTAKSGEFIPRPALGRLLFATAAPTTLSIDHAITHPSTANYVAVDVCILWAKRSQSFGASIAHCSGRINGLPPSLYDS